MKSFHLICVGKLKDASLEAIETDYFKRLNNPPLQIHELKASAENKEAEGEVILKKLKDLGDTHRVAMTEWGKRYTSVDFAKWTEKLLELPARTVFIIAGAECCSDEGLSSSKERL